MPGKIRILVVDDDRDVCDTLKDILELKDYEVTIALDGFTALDLAAAQKFDVALMDIKMPGMNGVETFKKFKEVAPGTPVIMVSAYAVEDLIREALSAGAFAALHKPLDFDLLFSTIESSMGGGAFILVVDDDRDICDVLERALSSRGYRVRTAPDGESAVDRVRENKFDVIILDMKLPAMNGFETYLAIRDIRPDLVAVIVTGYWDEMSSLVQRSIEKGAYISLRKPVDMERLFQVLEEVRKRKS